MNRVNKKNVHIELLRIISMLMIVYHHYYIHSGWDFPNYFSKKIAFLQIVGSFGKIGVIIFVLISGYFYSQQKFKIKKILRLSNIARWYSIIAIIILYFFFNSSLNISLQTILSTLFPITYQSYWFLAPYVFMMLLNPILKIALNNLDKYEKLKITVAFILVLHIPCFLGIITQTEGYFIPNNYIVFFYIILIGDLIKNYEQELLENYFNYVLLTSVVSLGLIISKGVIYQPYAFERLPNVPGSFLTGIESMNALIFSVTLFIIVLKIKVLGELTILYISPLVLDVYLFHDNRYIRPIIWKQLFNNKEFFQSSTLIIRTIFEPLFIFIVCILFAMIRYNFFVLLDIFFLELKL